MRGMVSIRGLLLMEPDLLNDWALPESVDLAELTNAILQECSELELLFPNAELFKRLSDSWSLRKLPGWQRAYNAMVAEYNPIHNFDRSEQYTDTESGGRNTTGSVSGSAANLGSGSIERKTSAYNSSTYEPLNKDETTDNLQTQSQTQSTGAETNTRSLQHYAHLSGNIGVTTSQQMVSDELKLSAKLDLIALIVRDFKFEFCLMVY